MSTVQ